MRQRDRLSALLLALVVTSSALACGCGSSPARRPNDIPARQLRANPRLAEGQRVFMHFCNQCHVGGAAGLGPSLNDKGLAPLIVKVQVRHGLGAMPAFPKRVISDSQLDDVTRYLHYLHQHPDNSMSGGRGGEPLWE